MSLWPLLLAISIQVGLERPDVEFRVFQFPADRIPRIDGQTDDWKIVPESYAIGTNELRETVTGLGDQHDADDLDVRVKVGWVEGLNQLYFLYEATDDYWDFGRPDLHNDIFEVVVDGDLSGGPLIRQMHPVEALREDRNLHFDFHGVHAQNYHILTPALDKEWTMVWGGQPWIKDLPYANAAQQYDFRPGESGRYVLEFWITPFDFAPAEPARAIPSTLTENKIIGLSWAILDYDDREAEKYDGFWNLSHKTEMYGDASDLVRFRLMPIEAGLRKPIEAKWSFTTISRADRIVAFRDRSYGEITEWMWDFGDGESSSEEHPTHTYAKAGDYVVTLTVTGPKGTSKWTKVWDVAVP